MGGSIAAQLSTGMSAALMERDAARAANVIPAVAGDGSLFPIDKM